MDIDNTESLNCSKLLDIFKRLTTAKTTEEVKEVENELKEISQNSQSYIDSIIEGLKIKDISSEISLSLAVNLKSQFQDNITKLSKEYIIQAQSKIVQLFFENPENLLLNGQFCGTLKIIYDSQIFQVEPKLLTNIINDYLHDFNNHFQGENLNKNELFEKFSHFMHLFLSVYSSVGLNKNNGLEITESICQNLFNKYLQLFIQEISSKNYTVTKIIVSVYEVINLMSLKLSQLKLDNDKIFNIFSFIYNFSYELIKFNPCPENNTNEIIICSNDDNLNDVINLVKSKAFQFFTNIISFEKNTIREDFNFRNMIIELTNKVILSLQNYNMSQMNILLNLTEDSSVLNKILYHILAFLNRTLIRDPLKDQAQPILMNLLCNGIIPLFVSSKKDLDQSKNEGEEYICFYSDLLEDKKYFNYKTAAAFLISVLCSAFPGLINTLISFILQLLEYSIILEKNLPLGSEHSFTLLQNFKDCCLMNRNILTNEKIIEICFLMLSLLHNELFSLKLLKDQFSKMLLSNYNDFHNTKSELFKFNLSLLYSYTLGNLIEILNESELNEFLPSALKFLFSQVLDSNSTAVNLQSADCINLLFSHLSEEDKNKVIKFFDAVLNEIIKIIPTNDTLNFYDMIISIVKDNKIKSGIKKYNLLNTLTEKAKKLKDNLPDGDNEFLVFKIFQIFLEFIKKNPIGLIDADSNFNYEKFEYFIQTMIDNFINIKDEPFDEIIYDIVSSFMKSNEKLSKVAPLLAQKIKEENLSTYHHEFFSVALKYSYLNNLPEQLQLTPMLKDILDKLIELMKSKDEQSIKFSVSLLGQYVLTLKTIPENYIQNIILFLTEKIPIEHENKNNELYISCLKLFSFLMINYCPLVVNYFYNFSGNPQYIPIGNFLTYLTETKFNYVYNDIGNKCIVMGLFNLFFFCAETNPEDAFNVILAMSSLLDLFIRIYKTSLETSMDCGFICDEEYEYDDLDENEKGIIRINKKKLYESLERERRNGKEIDLSWIKELQPADEYLLFYDAYSMLNEEVKKNIENSYKGLTPFKELLEIRRIEVKEDGKPVKFIPRRTIKLKKSNKGI